MKHHNDLSQHYRELHLSGAMPLKMACNRLKFLEENIHSAIDLAKDSYLISRDPAILEILGNLYISSGDSIIAQSLYRDCVTRDTEIHACNLIYAGMDRINAIVDDEAKVLYAPIPKCGSSTVKNYIGYGREGKVYGMTVHLQLNELTAVITRQDLEEKYADYYKFTVLRDPLERAASYYLKNVKNGSLQKEALGRTDFMGLSTDPTIEDYVSRFNEYRQLFMGFRHHTSPISSYLDSLGDSLSHIYQMDGLEEIREKLSAIYGKTIEDKKYTVGERSEEAAQVIQKCKQLKYWYADDYSSYFS